MTGTENNNSEKLLRKKLDLLLRTGKILVESLADTSRVLRNMKRTAAYLGLPEEDLHIHITYNMLMVNVSDEGHSFSKFQKCERHGVNMTAISAISKLSWAAITQNYTLATYESELNRISSAKRFYTPWQVAIGAGFACGGFCLQFGCDWIAFLYASIAAMIGFKLKHFLEKAGFNLYANIALTAFVCVFVAWLSSFLSAPSVGTFLPSWLASALHSSTPWHPMLACALFMIPGVPLINFVNDMLDNHVQVGLVRATNVLLIIAAMSFGIVLAIKVIGVDNFVTDLSIVPKNTYLVYGIAAAISAVGFSMIFNTPKRLLWIVALGGVVAVCGRNLVNLGPSNGNFGLGWGPIIGALAGSSLISIITIKLVHWFHTPHHCISIPAVITLIPGVLMYRALFGFIEIDGVVGEVTVAMTNGINASLIILCISIGVAIPNIFARKWIAPHRKAKLNRLISERKQRGEFINLDNVE